MPLACSRLMVQKMTKFQRLTLHIILLSLAAGCIPQKSTQVERIIPTETFTAIPTNTYSPTITITPSSIQPLVPSTTMAEMFRASEYTLETTITINEPGRYYQIQSWDNSTNDWGADQRVSIKNEPFETIWIEYARLGQLPQVDITGEGDPDVIIYGQGARLANPVYIYNLGDELTRVFMNYRPSSYRPSGCNLDSFEFKDLDNDGILEIITCDAAFGSFDCGPSMGPMPLIVYSYDSELMQYNIVNPLYPEVYSESIETLTKLAEESPKNKCIISDLVMDYFYSGQIEKGWSELTRIYQEDDVENFRQEMKDLLQFKREIGIFVLLEDLKTK